MDEKASNTTRPIDGAHVCTLHANSHQLVTGRRYNVNVFRYMVGWETGTVSTTDNTHAGWTENIRPQSCKMHPGLP